MEPIRTGVVCPACKEPVATIEARTAGAIVFRCPDCGYLRRVDDPPVPKDRTPE